jgi:hypothetical protein
MDAHCFLVKILDVRELADEVLSAWPRLAIDQVRKGVEVQSEVDTAYLRVAVAVPGAHPVYAALHGQDSEDHPNARLVPKVMKFLQDFSAETDATLARALLAKLPPGKSVGWHVDRGSYYQATARYHLAIFNEGATFRVETTTYEQHTGELWSFDNTKPHGAFNHTSAYRIHLIFDTQPAHLKARAEILKQKYSTDFYKNDPNRE